MSDKIRFKIIHRNSLKVKDEQVVNPKIHLIMIRILIYIVPDMHPTCIVLINNILLLLVFFLAFILHSRNVSTGLPHPFSFWCKHFFKEKHFCVEARTASVAIQIQSLSNFINKCMRSFYTRIISTAQLLVHQPFLGIIAPVNMPNL